MDRKDSEPEGEPQTTVYCKRATKYRMYLKRQGCRVRSELQYTVVCGSPAGLCSSHLQPRFFS